MAENAEREPTIEGDPTHAALVESARHEFERFGFRRANVEAIGRRAGVSRPTVYRRFPNKAALLRAVIVTDVAVFMERLDAALFGTGPARDRFADAFLLSVQELRLNPLLASMRETEPELLLAAFTFEGASEFALMRDLLTARVARLQEAEGLDSSAAPTNAELLLRLSYSVLLLPYGLFEHVDDAAIRALASTHLAPIVGLGS